jgi:Protein of unknown function (DUF3916)
MRRLDLHPDRKLRNPARHLRALGRWPERIVGQIPSAEDLGQSRFWNWKIPVYSKVVEGRHATPEAQRSAIAAIFGAAEAVERSPAKPPNTRTACLITTPFLFESEVTLFADEDYFRSFLPVTETRRTDFEGGWIEASLADPATLSAILPPAPAALRFRGGTNLLHHDDTWDESPILRTSWVWAFERQ